MKRSVTANAGKDYTCHVGDAGSSPACLATGSSVTGSTPALRSDVFSIPRRRDASIKNPRPWRMPEGLHRLVSARSRVRVPPGPSWGPVAQSVEQDVFPRPCRRNLNIPAGMPARTTFALVRKGLGYFLVPPPKKAGECRWEYIGGGFGLRFESASSHHPSSPAPIRRANAGRTTW